MTKLNLIVIVVLTFAQSILAQDAGFTMDDDEGCGFLAVHFTNTSTGTGTLSYNWTFGNGAESNDQNPDITYTSGGTYTVTLILTDENGTSAFSDQVVIHPFPNVAFSGNNLEGCVPLTTQFFDASTPGDANIISWDWNFGDGTSSTDHNPSHEYTHSGSYSIILNVEDALGCENNIIYQSYINVSNLPIVSFTPQPSINCEPINVSFTNSSSGDALPLSYSWNFGDGGSSNQSNPTHFFQAGIHNVNLNVTDANGCSASGQGQVSITTLSPNIQINPSAICTGQNVTFINTENSGSMWDFGDGSPLSYGIMTNHIYQNQGTYTIELTAGSGSCVTTVTQTINVHASPNIDFIIEPDVLCEPSTIQLNNSTTDAISYDWTIHAQTMTDAGIIFTSESINTNYYIGGEGLYYITLEATSSYGCVSEQTDTMQVLFTNITNVIANPHNGCVPFYTSFTPVINTNDNIISYNWYRDGVWFSSDEFPTPEAFTEQGLYEIELVIETEHNCTDSYTVNIYAGTHPDISFSLSEDSVCIGDEVQVDVTISDTINYYSYEWLNYAEGPVLGNEDSIVVPDGYGNFDLTLLVGIYGCNTEYTVSSAFFIRGPYLNNFEDLYSCSNPYLRNFSIDAFGYDTIYWNYGDMSPTETAGVAVQHLYFFEENYLLNITAHSETSVCPDYNLMANISIVEPDFTPETPEMSCPNLTLSLDTIPLVDSVFVYWGDGTYRNWMPDTFLIAEHTYSSGGLMNVQVIASGWGGCFDTTNLQVTIAFIDPLFTINPANICLGDSVEITNMANSIFPIIEYTWCFEDLDTIVAYSDTLFKYLYLEGGEHTINYKLIDSLGCEFTSDDRLINVHAINALVSVEDSTLCLGDELNINIEGDISDLQIECDFDDGFVSSTTLNHTYINTGGFYVEISLQDNYGCQQTFIIDSVSVQDANLNIFLQEDTLYCYPESPIFINNDTILSYEWEDNLGNTAFVPNPEFIYQERGQYQISVLAFTTNGCKDSTGFNLIIDGPYAEINISDNIVCKNDTVEFWMSNDTNIVNYEWTLGDGFGIANTMSFEHSFLIVPENGSFEIVLSYPAVGCDADGDGQDDKYKQIELINIFPVVADFELVNIETGLTDTNSCSPLSIQFLNHSQGNGNVYRWTIDDIDYSNEYQPDNYDFINNVSLIDTFLVALYLKSQEECKDTFYQEVLVRSVPEISISEQHLVCYGDEIELWATGGKFIEWTSEETILQPNDYHITVKPEESNMFYAKITEENLCENSDSVLVKVQQVPEFYSNYTDTLVVVGQEFNINISTDQEGVSYQWTPAIGLSCSDCPNPIVKVSEATNYIVTIVDSASCHTVKQNIFIDIFYDFTLDVPNTFTPNGDGENDIVFVRGWGLKDLLEFRIYNRWGEEVFFSDDLKQGWDGKKDGVAQNMDSYAYYVKVLTFSNVELTKKGTITLLR